MEIKQYEQYKNAIDQALGTLQFASPQSLYTPITYTLQLPAKRLRPVLTLLSAEMAGGNIEKALPAALAIELFHNFTLLHDDIMDEAPIRRGKASVFYQFGRDAAILSGDALLISAYRQLEVYTPDIQNILFKVLNHSALSVCEGQQLDMEYESNEKVSLSEYLSMIGLKTAHLIGAAMKMGALTAACSPALADAYFQIGLNMGMAFQIQDDWLDTFGELNQFGKKRGGDIVRNKKTFLLLSAMEKASESQKKMLHNLLNNQMLTEEEKIQSVRKLYHKLDIDLLSKSSIRKYSDQAIRGIEALQISESKTKVLLDILNQLIHRNR